MTITQLIDRESSGIDVDRVVWGPDGRWVYAQIATSELLSGESLDSSEGGTVAFIGSSSSIFAFEVNGIVHPMPLAPSNLSSSVRLIPTDDADEPGGQIGGGHIDCDLVWVP